MAVQPENTYYSRSPSITVVPGQGACVAATVIAPHRPLEASLHVADKELANLAQKLDALQNRIDSLMPQLPPGANCMEGACPRPVRSPIVQTVYDLADRIAANAARVDSWLDRLEV